MNEDDRNFNEVIISGKITFFNEFSEYTSFGISCNDYSVKNKMSYLNLNIHKDLYYKYKDLFILDNKVFIKGYLRSYKDKKNNLMTSINVVNISKDYKDIITDKTGPHVRYDPDGVMVWNGKRCETKEPTPEERKEMEELLKEYQ